MWWIIGIIVLIIFALPIGVYLDGKWIKKRLNDIDNNTDILRKKLQNLDCIILGTGFKQETYKNYNGLIKDVESFKDEISQAKNWTHSTHTQVFDWIKRQYEHNKDVRRQVQSLSKRIDALEQDIKNLRKDYFNLYLELHSHINNINPAPVSTKEQITP